MLSTARVRRPAFAAALMLSLVSGVALVHGSAAAAASGTFDVDAKTVTVSSSENLTIDRTDTGAIVISRRPGGRAVVLPCGDPTVTTVDRIDITVTGETRHVRIDQRNGRFTPGSATATAEEIAFTIDFGVIHHLSVLEVLGTEGSDTIGAGQAGVNFDRDDDVIADVRYPNRPYAVRLDGRGGDDVLDGDGSEGTQGPPPLSLPNISLVGGSGDDTLVDEWNDSTFVVYDTAPHGVAVDLEAGVATATASTDLNEIGTDTLRSIGHIVGSTFADDLRGDDGLNNILGLDGADVLDGRGGDDFLEGGWDSGAVIDYSRAPGPVTVDLSGVDAYAQGGDGRDRLQRIYGVIGSPFNDKLMVGGPVTSHVDGGGGVDTADWSKETYTPLIFDLPGKRFGDGSYFGWRPLLRVEHVVGTQTDDVMYGTSGVNVFSGAGGNDRIYGRG